uniref:Capsid protein n=1 Tax=uncultured marine virus TaxID=186617 RepID=S4TDN1_9VIRU|nr:hypothetical protein [uncultured marine virus]
MPFKKYGTSRANMSRVARRSSKGSGRKMVRSSNFPKTLQAPLKAYRTNYWPRFNQGAVGSRTKYVKLPYTSTTFTPAATIGGIVGATFKFGLNCLWDPYLSAGGHQPMGFDQWTAFYKRYKVYRCDIKIRVMHFGSDRCFVGAAIRGSQNATTIAGATYQELSERSNVATVIVESDSGDNQTIIERSFGMAEIEGCPITDTQYDGGDNGNPGNVIQLEVGCGQLDNLDTGAVKVIIELVYHVKFHDVVSLNLS